ncbi:hypothetical protein [Rhodanobacter lindaniclasticus]
MQVAFVDDLQLGRRQRTGQPLADLLDASPRRTPRRALRNGSIRTSA